MIVKHVIYDISYTHDRFVELAGNVVEEVEFLSKMHGMKCRPTALIT